jgi:tetratricopeptide (TPR) repeat protein
VATQASCPKCQSTKLRWLTVKRQVPIDVLQCQSCGVAIAEEDWVAPLMALIPGRCTNCGDRRDFDHCVNCGLTREEDEQVHDELRFMVAPEQNLLEASRTAVRMGRLLMGLKLATAATVRNENGQADVARALRVWLIGKLADHATALDDARAWVETNPDPSSIAWATFGQTLEAEFPGAAADAYDKALKKDRSQHQLRARRAQLLMMLHREGQAMEECCKVLETAGTDEQTVALALGVSEQLCELFETQLRDDEIQRMLERAGEHAEKSAKLLAHRARISASAGDLPGARSDLKKARKINPELDIYERVERMMKPQRTSWWRW